MKKIYALATLLWLTCSFMLTAQITKPEDFFGFKPGADRMLFDYEQLMAYMKKLDKESPRIKVLPIGKTMLGRPMYVILLSSSGNIRQIDTLKAINKKLALNASLTESQLKKLIDKGKVFVLATVSMHSDEVAPEQAVPLLAYEVAAGINPQLNKDLENVVYMIVPHNPDGMDMIVHNYNKYKGTPYEGSWYPGVYNKYVGHDNNRDFITLTQSETKAINRFYTDEWFPQVMVEKHQMWHRRVRCFVPPKHDPIAQNVDAELWTWDGLFGINMQKDMTAQGLKGVAHSYEFDDYWPGSTETSHWKNIISLLTEIASARIATPIYIEDNELYVSGKGLAEYKKSTNFPDPWPGGWWRLGDAVTYDLATARSIIHTAALHKNEILALRNKLCRKEIEKGKTLPPFYYIIPKKQHDPSELVRMINLLREHGISIYRLDRDLVIDGRQYQKGDFVIPLAQPFRAFIKEVMEAQEFPVRHYTKNGKMILPYDITTWSLPLHRGIRSDEIDKRSPDLEQHLQPIEGRFALKKQFVPVKYAVAVLPAANNDSYKAVFMALDKGIPVSRLTQTDTLNGHIVSKGSFLISFHPALKKILSQVEVNPVFLKKNIVTHVKPVQMPRIALVETYLQDVDAGWTRYLFDSYHIKYKVIHPGEFANTDFKKKFDIVIFPDNDKNILLKGRTRDKDGIWHIPFFPRRFTKGIGPQGMDRLMRFLNDGGHIIAWGRSTKLFEGDLFVPEDKNDRQDFVLPFKDISPSLRKKGLYCPGSLVQIRLKKDMPLTLGLPEKIGVFFRGAPVFQTTLPEFDMDRRVVAKFSGKNILLSGYAKNISLIANKPAVVWLKKNKGQLILFAFAPQFRASTPVAYKLIFNSLLMN